MDLERCVELYSMMARRCASSVWQNNQAKVYSEMADFIAQCDSVEDSMNQIKNSKYYLAPSVALTKDKICAWQKAAHENNMPDLEQVYADKLAKINVDESEIYATGYEQTAQNIKNKYVLTYQAFANIFNGFVGYISNGKDQNLRDIDNNLAQLKLPFSDFVELSKMSRFRELIPINDEGYSIFVDAIICHIQGGVISYQPNTIYKNEDIEQQVTEVLSHKREVKEVANSRSDRSKWKDVVAYSPSFKQNQSDISGMKYTYED